MQPREVPAFGISSADAIVADRYAFPIGDAEAHTESKGRPHYERALESVRVADFFAAVTRAAPSARKTEGWRPPREERRGGDDAEGRGGRGEWGDRAWVREPREAYEKLAVALGRPS